MQTLVSYQQYIEHLVEFHSRINLDEIKRAYDFAYKAHEGQKRYSGEDYIIHPLTVSYILSELHSDQSSIIAGLLHDVLEDTNTTFEQLVNEFGIEVAKLVDGVTKLQKYKYHTNHSRQDNQADNYRKLLLFITEDIRVILIKLADRLHNIQTIQYQDSDSQKRIAQETLEIYVPLANRFGLIKLQNEMEDLCLKVLDPLEYKNIAHFVSETKRERDEYIQQLVPLIQEDFEKSGLNVEIYGRIKHIYSIYRKRLIVTTQVPFVKF